MFCWFLLLFRCFFAMSRKLTAHRKRCNTRFHSRNDVNIAYTFLPFCTKFKHLVVSLSNSVKNDDGIEERNIFSKTHGLIEEFSSLSTLFFFMKHWRSCCLRFAIKKHLFLPPHGRSNNENMATIHFPAIQFRLRSCNALSGFSFTMALSLQYS